MSISKDFSKVKQKTNIQSNWTSFGTARSKFINEFADETLKKQLAHTALPESLLLLKQQFNEIQIGSEYFFQAMNFLCQGKESTVKEYELKSIRFHVVLSGFLLIRRAVNFGSTCMPAKVSAYGREILRTSRPTQKQTKRCRILLPIKSGNE